MMVYMYSKNKRAISARQMKRIKEKLNKAKRRKRNARHG